MRFRTLSTTGQGDKGGDQAPKINIMGNRYWLFKVKWKAVSVAFTLRDEGGAAEILSVNEFRRATSRKTLSCEGGFSRCTQGLVAGAGRGLSFSLSHALPYTVKQSSFKKRVHFRMAEMCGRTNGFSEQMIVFAGMCDEPRFRGFCLSSRLR